MFFLFNLLLFVKKLATFSHASTAILFLHSSESAALCGVKIIFFRENKG